MTANTNLTRKHFSRRRAWLFRAPVLISGVREAVLIDSGFTLADGKALVGRLIAAAEADGHLHRPERPDYYFSLAPIRRRSLMQR